LSFAIKEKISLFYKTPNALNDIIRKLHIVIDFIISSGFTNDSIKIMDYAVNVLKMTSGVDDADSNKQVNELEVTYLQSLWNSLSLRRVILLTEHGQDPFDQLSYHYRVAIDAAGDAAAAAEATAATAVANEESEYDEATMATNEANKKDARIIEKLKKHRQHINLSNLYGLLDFVYKLIVFKLIPTKTVAAAMNAADETMNNAAGAAAEATEDETVQMNPQFEIKFVLSADSMDDDDLNGTELLQFSLDDYDLTEIRLENVHHLWKLLIKIYLDLNNLKV
jgi:hypothetical protein